LTVSPQGRPARQQEKEDELNKLRYLLLVAVALTAGIAGGMISTRFLQGFSEEDIHHRNIVVAHEFHLVDEEGKQRWLLTVSKDGEPALTFVNKSGWAPMAMGINREGVPFFNMVLEPNQSGGPSLVLMDSRMKSRALLGLSKEGEPQLAFLDHAGQRRLAMGCAEFPNPLTGVQEKRPCSSITLFDEQGKVLWSAPEFKPLPITLSSAGSQPQMP
jgi:hypothetical protein